MSDVIVENVGLELGIETDGDSLIQTYAFTDALNGKSTVYPSVNINININLDGVTGYVTLKKIIDSEKFYNPMPSI